MDAPKRPSLEELVRLHQIVEAPITAWELDSGMVLRAGGRLRLVISVEFEKTQAGVVAIVETFSGLGRLASDSQVPVWHMDGRPFIGDPLDEYGNWMPGCSGGGPTAPPASPAQDAAGIMPVWRGPKRPV